MIASLVFGALRRILLRVGVFAGFAAAAFVISEQIAKPVVGERFFGELSFPSGNVTAVCATAVAMWIALYPVLGKWARGITFVFGAAWTLLMSVAVVGAIWHTPLDCVGSVLLSSASSPQEQPSTNPSRLRVPGRLLSRFGSWEGSEGGAGAARAIASRRVRCSAGRTDVPAVVSGCIEPLCLPPTIARVRECGADHERWRTALTSEIRRLLGGRPGWRLEPRSTPG